MPPSFLAWTLGWMAVAFIRVDKKRGKLSLGGGIHTGGGEKGHEFSLDISD